MTDQPWTHDFDWITARHKCSVANEFTRLQALVEIYIAARKKLLTSDALVDFRFETDRDQFTVARFPVSGANGRTYTVAFVLREDHIRVTSDWAHKNAFWTLRVTLNDGGECRFSIDGDGEYLRWQVARRTLCGLLFDGPQSGGTS